MKKLLLFPLIILIMVALPILTACSESIADESDIMANSRSEEYFDLNAVGEIYKFKQDTVIIIESGKEYATNPFYESKFVPIVKIDTNSDFRFEKDEIRLHAAYSYDIPKFGTGLDPWINLNIKSTKLPANLEWLSVQVDEVDGEIGLTVAESPDAAPWQNPYVGERAIKLEIIIPLDDTQCAVCSLMVIHHRLICDSMQPENGDGILYSFEPSSTLVIPSDGGMGAVTLSYKPDGWYELLKSEGWAIPERIQFSCLTVSERIGDSIIETEESGGDSGLPNNGWRVFRADRIMDSDGICDLGWAKIRISDNPDGSKRFEYNFSKNTSGQRRQVRLEDWPQYRGPEYKLGRFCSSYIFWNIIITQDK